jgi:hypothetical protein
MTTQPISTEDPAQSSLLDFSMEQRDVQLMSRP